MSKTVAKRFARPDTLLGLLWASIIVLVTLMASVIYSTQMRVGRESCEILGKTA